MPISFASTHTWRLNHFFERERGYKMPHSQGATAGFWNTSTTGSNPLLLNRFIIEWSSLDCPDWAKTLLRDSFHEERIETVPPLLSSFGSRYSELIFLVTVLPIALSLFRSKIWLCNAWKI